MTQLVHIVGHAIVSADGKIASADGSIPPSLQNAADWERFQTSLDQSDLVVLGRIGHRTYPNKGRNRLVATTRVDTLATDPTDNKATLWNPSAISFEATLIALGLTSGMVAIAGVFDLFVSHFTAFDLAESNTVLVRDGLPCFSSGHPCLVLANAGLRPEKFKLLDPAANVTLTSWAR